MTIGDLKDFQLIVALDPATLSRLPRVAQTKRCIPAISFGLSTADRPACSGTTARVKRGLSALRFSPIDPEG